MDRGRFVIQAGNLEAFDYFFAARGAQAIETFRV
jgi:hypothetical protein